MILLMSGICQRKTRQSKPAHRFEINRYYIELVACASGVSRLGDRVYRMSEKTIPMVAKRELFVKIHRQFIAHRLRR